MWAMGESEGLSPLSLSSDTVGKVSDPGTRTLEESDSIWLLNLLGRSNRT